MPRAVILTALPVEYLAVRRHLRDIHEEIEPKGTIYERGIFTASDITWEVGIAEIGEGNSNAALEAERAIAHFNPQIILYVGIAWGIKNVTIGDVVAARKIYAYEIGTAEKTFLPQAEIGMASYILEQRARAEARKDDWLKRLSFDVERLTPIFVKKEKNDIQPIPRAIIAPIAAGEKLVTSTKSEIYKLIESTYSDAVALEREGFGFLSAARSNIDVPAMVIRGISDLIERPDNIAANDFQELASRRASAFAFEILAKFKPEDRSSDRPTKFNIAGDYINPNAYAKFMTPTSTTPEISSYGKEIDREDIEAMAKRIESAAQKQVAADISLRKEMGKSIHYTIGNKLVREEADGQKFEIELQADGSEKVIGKVI
jgi:nucleoside phosphorylase